MSPFCSATLIIKTQGYIYLLVESSAIRNTGSGVELVECYTIWPPVEVPFQPNQIFRLLGFLCYCWVYPLGGCFVFLQTVLCIEPAVIYHLYPTS